MGASFTFLEPRFVHPGETTHFGAFIYIWISVSFVPLGFVERRNMRFARGYGGTSLHLCVIKKKNSPFQVKILDFLRNHH